VTYLDSSEARYNCDSGNIGRLSESRQYQHGADSAHVLLVREQLLHATALGLQDDSSCAACDERAAGVVPVAVLASAGTVNIGAVDPLGEIAEVCSRHDAWPHVDAAYGGPAMLLLDKWASCCAGLARADSIAVDPHKWLYVPVDAGLVLFADHGAARDAFSLVPDYLRTDEIRQNPCGTRNLASNQPGRRGH
jgi:glutamate/tyrosine decarboxylase-like PLP-dependent enzyme